MTKKVVHVEAEHGLKDVAVAMGSALGKLAHKLGLGETPAPRVAQPPKKAATPKSPAPKKKAASKKKAATKKAPAKRAGVRKVKSPAKRA